MRSFGKYLLAAIVVLLCVGVGTSIGCVVGVWAAGAIPGVVQTNGPGARGSIEFIADNNWLTGGAMIGTSFGALLGMAGGGLLGAKIINPPPPRE